MKNFWLMKSEPDEYSIDHLKKDRTTPWFGVRNYQARNFMRDEMKKGDLVLFYHSNANPSGVAGLAEVSKTGMVDELQFESKSEYFDPKSKKENPTWLCVEVKFVEKFKTFVSLEDLKNESTLKKMLVIKKGQRLSVQPVALEECKKICKMGGVSFKI